MTIQRFCNIGVPFCILLWALGCNNSNTPSSSPAKTEQLAQEQKKLDEKTAEVTKEQSETEAKNKEISDKANQIADAQNQIEQEKAALEKLKLNVEGAAATNAQNLQDIAELAKDPLYRMTARLALGQNVPVLLYVLGTSIEQIHGIEIEFAALNVGPKFFSKLELEDPEKISGVFIATLNSAEKFKNFQNYVHNNSQAKVLTIPLSGAFVRSSLELSYVQAMPLQRLFTERFWIGDSPIKIIDPSQPFNLNDVAYFVPYLKNCSAVTVDCLKTLISQNYFKIPSSIEDKSQDPLSFLERQLGETAWLIGGDVAYRGSFSLQHPRNSSMPIVEEVTLINTVWAVSDLSYASTVADFFGDRAASYMGQVGNNGTYVTPISFETRTAPITGNKNVDLPVNVVQLHNYICSVKVCINPISK